MIGSAFLQNLVCNSLKLSERRVDSGLDDIYNITLVPSVKHLKNKHQICLQWTWFIDGQWSHFRQWEDITIQARQLWPLWYSETRWEVDQRRTYMMEIQYRDCMLVRVIWGPVGGRGHQGLNARVAFWDCSRKWQILQTQGFSIMMRDVVGNEQ